MNKLDFVISLRQKGLDSVEIKKQMLEQGFEESEIASFLKKSDEIFLNQLNEQQISNPNEKPTTIIKVITFIKKIALVLSLLILIAILFGYVRSGVLGIIILWSIVAFGSSRK